MTDLKCNLPKCPGWHLRAPYVAARPRTERGAAGYGARRAPGRGTAVRYAAARATVARSVTQSALCGVREREPRRRRGLKRYIRNTREGEWER